METSDEETRPSLAHYSTGRLTAAQAATVAAWRDRLREDAPLPGIRPKPEALRLLGLDDRPAASCSDVIAAAVADLLDHALPAELDLARYAHCATEAQKQAGQGHPSTRPSTSP
ncbi:hypothetical protein ACWDR1_33865 [Streptosporangium sandarakinum]